MTDGLGQIDYEYDSLSRITAETRDFNDSLQYAPIAGSKYRLEYTYQIGGQLRSVKDPYGQQINYSYDKTARLNKVEGSASFGGVTTYAEDPVYRAWGGLKSLSYGNGTSMSLTYNNRLQTDGFDLVKSASRHLSFQKTIRSLQTEPLVRSTIWLTTSLTRSILSIISDGRNRQDHRSRHETRHQTSSKYTIRHTGRHSDSTRSAI